MQILKRGTGPVSSIQLQLDERKIIFQPIARYCRLDVIVWNSCICNGLSQRETRGEMRSLPPRSTYRSVQHERLHWLFPYVAHRSLYVSGLYFTFCTVKLILANFNPTIQAVLNCDCS